MQTNRQMNCYCFHGGFKYPNINCSVGNNLINVWMYFLYILNYCLKVKVNFTAFQHVQAIITHFNFYIKMDLNDFILVIVSNNSGLYI